MRLSFLLAIGLITATLGEAQSQTAPSTPVLPSVEKPKSSVPATTAPIPDPDPDLNADPNAAAVPAEVTPAEAAIPNPANGNGSKIRRQQAARQTSTDSSQGDSAAGDTNQGPEYTGPAILSRGMNFVRPSIPANERFRPFAGLNFVRDSGIAGQYQGTGSTLTSATGNSVDINYGITGQHVRKADVIQLDYRGHSLFGGLNASQDQALSLGYKRVLARRLTATLSESAGLYSSNYSVLNSIGQTDTSVGNTTLVSSPNTEPYNDRTYYSTTGVDVVYQRSARLSFDFGGSYFSVRRNSSSLISIGGYQTRVDVAYRFTKRSTIGPYYAYSRYDYSGTFGDTGIHTVGLNYSVSLNKATQFGFRFGGTRLESRGLQTVNLDPAIAAILGTPVGIQRFYTIGYLPDIAANLSRSFRRGSVGFAYSRGVSPGNGIILTSQHDSETVSYSYDGIRKYALALSGGRDNLTSQVQNTAAFASYYGRVQLSHPLPHSLQSIFALEYRKPGWTNGQYNTKNYNSNQYRISIGLAYSPGLGPLKFW